MLRRLFPLVALFTMLWTSAEAQITATYTFSPGTVIRSADVNANFSQLGDALNRTGGTMTGSLTVNNVLPEADNTRDLGSAALSFNDAWFDGTATIATATITSASVTSFSAALLPNADNTLDLGSAAASWNDLWIDGTATIGTLSLTTLTCTGCVDATQLAATTVTAAAYGSASGVATFTVDADGRLTAAATTTIAIAATQVTSGNYVATVTAGSGIAVGTGTGTGSTPAFSLTALTADWTQSGAYDIVLSNAGAEIKIKESTGDTYYGILEVGDLAAADATYTFSGTSGTVLTSVTAAGGDVSGTYSALVVGNDSHTHDAGNLTGTTLAAGVVTTSITTVGTIGTGTWNGTDVAVTAGGTGVGTFTANGILYGNTTSALQVTGAGTSAQIFQANGTGVPGFVTLSGDASVAVGGAVTVANDSHTHDAGNLTGATLAAGVLATSITSTGTVTSGTWSASFGNAAVSSVAGGTYTGDDSIATVGTITAGVWNAGAVTSSGAFTSSTSVALTGTTNNLGTITTGVWNAGAVTSSGVVTGAGVSTAPGLKVSITQSGETVRPYLTFRNNQSTYKSWGFAKYSYDSLTLGYGADTDDPTTSAIAQTWLDGGNTTIAGVLTVSGGYEAITMNGTAANIALGSNYLSGDGGDEGILVSSTGMVAIGGATLSTTQLNVARSGVVTAGTTTGYFSNSTTNSTTDGIDKIGVYGEASGAFLGSGGGSTIAYGVYGSASGADVNYAGYFSGDLYTTADMSALTITDRTPYPPDLQTAYAAILAMRRLPDGQYKLDDPEFQLDHSTLHPYLTSVSGNRNLSATVSSLVWMVQDYERRIAALEAQLKAK